jgi:dihydroorotate dehydrogenase
VLADLALPLFRLLPPEAAHDATIRALALGLGGRSAASADPALRTRVWGLDFPNPVGLAAGFDKNARVPDAMLRLGFGFVEVGSVTPRPQPGNAKPRVFRLPEDRAVINRYGFNNDGLERVAARLRRRRGRPGIVGVNLGKNRDTLDAASDYIAGIAATAALADYLVVNVSSPNTPGLRDLQRKSELTALAARLIDACRAACRNLPGQRPPPPLLLKIAPDLTGSDLEDIAAVALSSGIDGVIVSNTTVTRPPVLKGAHAHEPGGLSGRPLFGPSTAVLKALFRLTAGRLPLVGVGGVSSGADAYAKIRAGASLVQLYTALVYQGPGLAARITHELSGLLRRDGFPSVSAAVGVDSAT